MLHILSLGMQVIGLMLLGAFLMFLALFSLWIIVTAIYKALGK